MVGLYAMSELLVQCGEPGWEQATRASARIRFPGPALWRRIALPQAIGSVIGAFEGIMPGAGGTVASFLSYNEARRWSRHPEEFGHGSPEGIAAPEAANNTVACTALVPMLSLGIPGSNSAAVLLGGFLMHGLIPGPMLFVKHAEVVDGLYAGLFAANVAMLVIGYLIMAPCIWLVSRPKPYMAFIYALVVSGACHRDEPLPCRRGARLRAAWLRDALFQGRDAASCSGSSSAHGGVELSPRAQALRRQPQHLHTDPISVRLLGPPWSSSPDFAASDDAVLA